MCLAVPAKIIHKQDMIATVEVDGIRRNISMMLLPEAKEGDYILMHAGFAIQVVDEQEALETTKLMKEVFGVDDSDLDRKGKATSGGVLA